MCIMSHRPFSRFYAIFSIFRNEHFFWNLNLELEDTFPVIFIRKLEMQDLTLLALSSHFDFESVVLDSLTRFV